MKSIDQCPKNLSELKEASIKLACKNDTYGNNQYLCLPNEEKTSLYEICFEGIIGMQERGKLLFIIVKQSSPLSEDISFPYFNFVYSFSE